MIPNMPTTAEIAAQASVNMSKVVDTLLTSFEVDKAADPKSYFKVSREVLKALIAALTQRMFDDGANPALVGETLTKGGRIGWQVFLDAHPEIKAKVEKEQSAKATSTMYAAGFNSGDGLEDGDDDGEDDDNDLN